MSFTFVRFSSLQMCCSGQISSKPSGIGIQNPRCCGTQGYNPATQVTTLNLISEFLFVSVFKCVSGYKKKMRVMIM